jgi:putative two-component system response regulator
MAYAERHKPTILVVDDTPDNLAQISAVLRNDYRVKIAINGKGALATAADTEDPVDMILLDVMLPDMDGYEVCKRLKEQPELAEIPVIFVTARSDVQDEEKGFSLGAVDYITKPISPPIVKARIQTHLRMKCFNDFLKDKNAFLEAEVERRTREVETIQDVTMVSLGSLAETRDNETGDHIRRTQRYIQIIAEVLRDKPRFRLQLNDHAIEMLCKSAPLHDIGKVGIPDCILKKPGKLDPDEFEIMKTHTTLGHDAITSAVRRLGASAAFLSTAREIAWTHHERWDGTGYPRGLSGDVIPLAGRLMAVADVYDALISRRVYKDKIPHEDAVDIIQSGSGTQFDPDVVSAFMAKVEKIEEVSNALSNSNGGA